MGSYLEEFATEAIFQLRVGASDGDRTLNTSNVTPTEPEHRICRNGFYSVLSSELIQNHPNHPDLIELSSSFFSFRPRQFFGTVRIANSDI